MSERWDKFWVGFGKLALAATLLVSATLLYDRFFSEAPEIHADLRINTFEAPLPINDVLEAESLSEIRSLIQGAHDRVSGEYQLGGYRDNKGNTNDVPKDETVGGSSVPQDIASQKAETNTNDRPRLREEIDTLTRAIKSIDALAEEFFAIRQQLRDFDSVVEFVVTNEGEATAEDVTLFIPNANYASLSFENQEPRAGSVHQDIKLGSLAHNAIVTGRAWGRYDRSNALADDARLTYSGGLGTVIVHRPVGRFWYFADRYWWPALFLGVLFMLIVIAVVIEKCKSTGSNKTKPEQ